jgi:hypothetical protein
VQTYASGVGPYNAFDKGTSLPMRWGNQSATVLDPSDDMTMWTVQEFTAVANTVGSSNAQWGIQVAKILAPFPSTPMSAYPSAIGIGSDAAVTITGAVGTPATGFFEPKPGRGTTGHLTASFTPDAGATGSVLLLSASVIDPQNVRLHVSTTGAEGKFFVTITNPDGQSATSAAPILIVSSAVADSVHFFVTIPSGTPSNDRIFLAGNFNGWDPKLMPMKKIDPLHWKIAIGVSPGTALQYKYTRGSWVNVEKAKDGSDISNRTFMTTNIADTLRDVVENWAIWTGVQEDASVPSAFALGQNYPNPFNPETGIRYQVSGISNGATFVSLKVFDLLGREVATLVNEQKPPGRYEVRFDGAGLASGVYLCRMAAGEFIQTRKLVLMK